MWAVSSSINAWFCVVQLFCVVLVREASAFTWCHVALNHFGLRYIELTILRNLEIYLPSDISINVDRAVIRKIFDLRMLSLDCRVCMTVSNEIKKLTRIKSFIFIIVFNARRYSVMLLSRFWP